MKTIKLLVLLMIPISLASAQQLFDESGKSAKHYKIGSYTNFDGNTINVVDITKPNALNVKQEQNNQMRGSLKISGYLFHRNDHKTFKSEDLKKWTLVNIEQNLYGTDDAMKSPDMIITQNIVGDVLTISGSTDEKYEIYSLYGIKVQEGFIKPQIDLSQLSPGFYIVKTKNTMNKFIKY